MMIQMRKRVSIVSFFFKFYNKKFVVDSDHEFEQLLKERERQLDEEEKEKEERKKVWAQNQAAKKAAAAAASSKKSKKKQEGDEQVKIYLFFNKLIIYSWNIKIIVKFVNKVEK